MLRAAVAGEHKTAAATAVAVYYTSSLFLGWICIYYVVLLYSLMDIIDQRTTCVENLQAMSGISRTLLSGV